MFPLFRCIPIILPSLWCVALSASCFAQQVNLKLGDAAPAWKDLVGVDEKSYALDDFKQRELLVVVFTCNSCPYAVDYEDRLVAFAKEFTATGKVAVVAINANKVPEDQPGKMQERAKSKGFSFPYVWDESQQTARDHGAIFTPEFFVFDQERHLAYHGAFDDNSQAALVTKPYLRDAVNALLAGKQPSIPETSAVGCGVRYERKKRERK